MKRILKKYRLTIGIVIAALVLITAFLIYSLCFDYYIELEDNDRSELVVEYGEQIDKPKVKALKKGHIFNRKGKEIKVNVDVNIDESKLGEYEAIATAKYKKKEVTHSIKVKIVDTTAPELTLLGDAEVTMETGQSYEEPGFNAVDTYDGDITDKVVVSGIPDTSPLKDFSVTYTAKDSSGNETILTRNVKVIDTIAPEITLAKGSTIYVEKGKAYKEPGFSAVDNCDGDITANVTVSGNVDTSNTGKYTLTYEVSDASGNKASVTRDVRVYAPVSVNTVNPGNKVIYLTFDDGPGPYTDKLLSILDEYNVKATFFVTNTHPDYQSLIAKEASKGHTVAIHSATHDYAKIYRSVDAYFDDFNTMNNIIIAQTGKSAQIVRFPGGSSNTISRKYCSGIMSQLVCGVAEKGFLYCDWNVSSGDAGGTTSTSQVVQNVTSGVKNNNVSIVLQHDIKDFSVNAVEEIIQWGLSEGYTFLPLTTSSPMSHHGVNN